MAMAIVATENTATEMGPEPGGEHVVRPHTETDEADCRTREHHEGVPEQRLAGERREHLGNDPERGRTMMYTSGWPNNQKRCCQSSGSAPSATEKNVASKFRWKSNRNSATVITGTAKRSRNCTTIAIQVKIGIRIRLCPGRAC